MQLNQKEEVSTVAKTVKGIDKGQAYRMVVDAGYHQVKGHTGGLTECTLWANANGERAVVTCEGYGFKAAAEVAYLTDVENSGL